jgi:hypothetical protein
MVKLLLASVAQTLLSVSLDAVLKRHRQVEGSPQVCATIEENSRIYSFVVPKSDFRKFSSEKLISEKSFFIRTILGFIRVQTFKIGITSPIETPPSPPN